ncbi:uncharacterized protein A4U43_C01F30840 [Asparagus officinalis]|uniref:SHSP domain-containing protein n=1 Tax=Asparagus officinalis TaxID=4686 RepID=A0A5P1FVQ6_ASPOF|nr:17.1 kDa class II heat shock protein-like [Asparagus officinalis]ONK81587.1 uncharacterized protein A4U43_C01F30840 [Asparagus officinalis]
MLLPLREIARACYQFSTFLEVSNSTPLSNFARSPKPAPPPPINSSQFPASPSQSGPQHFQSHQKSATDVRMFDLENPLLSTLHHLIADVPDETERSVPTPTGTYVRDARAMASTPLDVKELPAAYSFVVDMPGVKSGEIKVQIEDDNVLVISGERKREGEEKEGEGKYLRMERRMGKFMRKFRLPEDADLERVTAESKDGVLTVTVMKKPPPEPKKSRTVQVRVA